MSYALHPVLPTVGHGTFVKAKKKFTSVQIVHETRLCLDRIDFPTNILLMSPDPLQNTTLHLATLFLKGSRTFMVEAEVRTSIHNPIIVSPLDPFAPGQPFIHLLEAPELQNPLCLEEG